MKTIYLYHFLNFICKDHLKMMGNAKNLICNNIR